MICHHHKCIFIHIPKNAGQSIEQIFVDLLQLKWETRAPLLLRHKAEHELGPPRLAHLKASEYVHLKHLPQSMFDEYFKFTFVRNPWSRVVSIYKHLRYVGQTKLDFKTFLLNELEYRFFLNIYWFVGLQSEFIYSNQGELLVDYVGHFEDLQSDFNEICKAIKLHPIKVPHVNSSKAYYINASHNSRSYKDYFDQESIDVVYKLYKKDIELFKYDFE